MQRLLDLAGQLAVGLQGHEDVGGFDADLEVLEVVAVEDLGVAQGGFHQRVAGRFAVLALQLFFQGAGVDADADRHAVVAGGFDHRAHPVLAADVARVDAQAVGAFVGHFQGDLVVVVDVRHQRQAHLLADFAEGFGGIHGGHRNAHDIRAHTFQRPDLGDGGVHVAGVGVGHALHGDRRIAAHRHGADVNLTGFTALNGDFRFHANS